VIDPLARNEIPRLVLAAASSDAGKTTVALGLVAAFRKRGLAVSAAKTGPDFIDAAHLAHAAGRPARNLDAFLAPEEAVRGSFARGAANADVAVVEGAMGLFDGRHGTGEGSSAHIARLLEAPVVLVLDCAKASSTIGAIAYGLARFDPRIRVAGAILNRVASTKHAATVIDAVRSAGVTVFGVLRRDERIALPSRALGLVEPGGVAWQTSVDHVAEALEREVDLDALLACARAAPPLAAAEALPASSEATPVRIAIARDEAFWFYDEASLETLALAGAELVPYAPLRDPFPADVAGAFVGGGYPELHAEALARNVAARDGLRRAIAEGMPIYAECGGLMYLGDALEAHGATHAMVGAVPAIATLGEKRSALRYVEARVLGAGPLFAAGEAVRGHEFHYSRTRYAVDRPAFAIDDEREGFRSANVHASYVHVHLGAHPAAARAFTAQARAFATVRHEVRARSRIV
jgi:cobyrinic acid a,c-diamide synthase